MSPQEGISERATSRRACAARGALTAALLAAALAISGSSGVQRALACGEDCGAPGETGGTVQVQGSTLEVSARAGDSNAIAVSYASGAYTIADTGAPLTAGPGCAATDASRVVCSGAVSLVRVAAGDRDDTVAVASSAAPVDLQGGLGADRLTGGPSSDALSGGPGGDVLTGGAGADSLSGGSERDRADYSTRTAAVAVSLDGRTGDGERDEGDTVAADVEDVRGGLGGDTLVGNASSNELEGGAGPDAVVGGEGADELSGDAGADTIDSRDAASDDVECGSESDLATVDAFDDADDDCERIELGTPAAGDSSAGSIGGGSGVAELVDPTAPETAPVSFASQVVTMVDERFIPVSISCPVTATRGCRGTLTLELPAAGASARAGGWAGAARRRGRVRPGTARFWTAAGQTAVVKVKISRRGRPILRRLGRVRVDARIARRGGGTISRRLIVKQRRRR